MNRSDDCASGIHDFCGPCDCECHGVNFTKEEVRGLYKLLMHQYIPDSNEGAHTALSKIAKIVHADEITNMARRDSSST